MLKHSTMYGMTQSLLGKNPLTCWETHPIVYASYCQGQNEERVLILLLIFLMQFWSHHLADIKSTIFKRKGCNLNKINAFMFFLSLGYGLADVFTWMCVWEGVGDLSFQHICPGTLWFFFHLFITELFDLNLSLTLFNWLKNQLINQSI